jgi:hypothetical protein
MDNSAYGPVQLDDLVLPFDLEWPDRYDWGEIVQTPEYGAQGELIVQWNRRLAGRPIHLTGTISQSWEVRSGIEALKAKSAANNDPMNLTFSGESYWVIWDRENKEIEAREVLPTSIAYSAATDRLYLTLRFLQVPMPDASGNP